jgi:putative ABC transport system ATP-binding protein
MLAIEIQNLSFGYRGPVILTVDEFSVERGERVFVYGPSGSGKTTLLGLIGGILQPRSGMLKVLGKDLSSESPARRDAFRGAHIGFIFQMFNLIPYLTVGENILLPTQINPVKFSGTGNRSGHLEYAKKLADRLNIHAQFDDAVIDLSVGQQQRVAAARALINRPEIVIADEPTSALDSERRTGFIELLLEASADSKSTLIFVSHDRSLQNLFHRAVSLPEINRARK